MDPEVEWVKVVRMGRGSLGMIFLICIFYIVILTPLEFCHFVVLLFCLITPICLIRLICKTNFAKTLMDSLRTGTPHWCCTSFRSFTSELENDLLESLLYNGLTI